MPPPARAGAVSTNATAPAASRRFATSSLRLVAACWFDVAATVLNLSWRVGDENGLHLHADLKLDCMCGLAW